MSIHTLTIEEFYKAYNVEQQDLEVLSTIESSNYNTLRGELE